MSADHHPAPSVPVELARQRWGSTAARPSALLVHGLTSSAGTWWRVASELADRGWSVTAVDLRGHGASPRTTRYRLADYAADLALVHPPAAEVTGDPVAPSWDVVVGHSLGAAASVLAAAAHPEWSRSLVLVDPVLTLPESGVDALIAELLAELAAPDADTLLRDNPRWHGEDAVQKLTALRVVSPFVVERTIRDNPDWALESTVARIPVPVRALAADPAQGASFLAESGDRLAELAPDFSYSVVSGASHSVHRDEPQRVVDEVLATAPR